MGFILVGCLNLWPILIIIFLGWYFSNLSLTLIYSNDVYNNLNIELFIDYTNMIFVLYLTNKLNWVGLKYIKFTQNLYKQSI